MLFRRMPREVLPLISNVSVGVRLKLSAINTKQLFKNKWILSVITIKDQQLTVNLNSFNALAFATTYTEVTYRNTLSKRYLKF